MSAWHATPSNHRLTSRCPEEHLHYVSSGQSQNMLQPFPASKVLSSLSVPCPLRNLMRISAVPKASAVEFARETIETCQRSRCLAHRVTPRILDRDCRDRLRFLDAMGAKVPRTVERRASRRTELHLDRPASEDASGPTRPLRQRQNSLHAATEQQDSRMMQ